MSKLNPNKKSGGKFDTERLAGGSGMLAAKNSPYDTLRRCVMACMLWENIAYMDGEKVADTIQNLIPQIQPELVAEIAIDARKEQKLRHTPLFIAVCMLKHEKHARLVGELLPKIITRADMITDFLAIYQKVNGHIKPLAKQAKIGLGAAFDNFNEYQLAKYDRNAPIKLRDVLFLVHAKPALGREELFKKIANRELATPDTWEVALSAGKDKKEVWTRLISENKLGALAFMRNLRAMSEAGVPKGMIASRLVELNGHMLLPMNYIQSAMHAPEFKSDIQFLMTKSYSRLNKLPGKTLIVVDRSGSMNASISDKGELKRIDAAIAMAMLAVNLCEDYVVVATAGNDHSREGSHEIITNPSRGFDISDQIKKANVGAGGIFTRQCMEWCRENVGDVDRIIVFSDSQDCDRVKTLPKPYGTTNYICDVSNHVKGINYKGVWTSEISGFSEHFMTFIAISEGLSNPFEN